MGISFKSIQSVLALFFGRIRRERTGWPTLKGLWKVVRSERTLTDARRHQRGELEDAFSPFLYDRVGRASGAEFEFGKAAKARSCQCCMAARYRRRFSVGR